MDLCSKEKKTRSNESIGSVGVTGQSRRRGRSKGGEWRKMIAKNKIKKKTRHAIKY